MALSVKNKEADRLARDLAEITGESLTEAVLCAIRERLEREQARRSLVRGVTRLVEEIAEYPVLDKRSAEEILGFDEAGLPR